MKKITDTIKKIENKHVELCCAIEELERMLVYEKFGGDTPEATISNDGEVFLEYHGKEMNKDNIEYAMMANGYITPYDFI